MKFKEIYFVYWEYLFSFWILKLKKWCFQNFAFDFKMEIFFKVLEQLSVKAKNKIAKTDINLNFITFNFYLFKKNESKSNFIKNYLKLKY